MIAIATTYGGVHFRSRLEARWAAFFDLLAWRWDYEPIDLPGYIPDFLIHFPHRPILAEVKPIDAPAGFGAYCESLGRVRTEREILLVGVSPHVLVREGGDDLVVGKLHEPGTGPWTEAPLSLCRECQGWSLFEETGSGPCRAKGCDAGDAYLGGGVAERATALWHQATNKVQWQAAR